ncbi:hypothetical protein JZ751_022783 [Albula glossodonta]|uniref:Transmembrane protein 126A n=1 Tax=Albula glossodonta TaxID=121402 RepID=A0A8T2PMD2_9TELE|nr:hypothetical protein JZ751_022783 [Albula glossodonta]
MITCNWVDDSSPHAFVPSQFSMPQISQPVKDNGNMPAKSVGHQLLLMYERLPEKDKKSFAYGPMYLGGSAAVVGLIANSLFRGVLNVTQGLFTSSLPMAFLPFFTTFALYNGVVSQPLLSGELNCATCALIRGGLVGGFAGGLYPVILALPINGGLARRYKTSPLPEKGNVLRYWITVTQPILRRLNFGLLLQAVFGMYLSSIHHGIYIKMFELPAADDEELTD